MKTLRSAYDLRSFHGIAQLNVQVLRETPVPKSAFAPSELNEQGNPDVAFPSGDCPEKIANLLRAFVSADPEFDWERETFFVLLLNTRRRVIAWQKVSIGTLDTLLVHARDVFRAAIVANAAAIVVAHTHPSGDASPSEADIRVTRDLIRGGQLLKIEVLDHVIIGAPTGMVGRGWSSLKELGYFYAS